MPIKLGAGAGVADWTPGIFPLLTTRAGAAGGSSSTGCSAFSTMEDLAGACAAFADFVDPALGRVCSTLADDVRSFSEDAAVFPSVISGCEIGAEFAAVTAVAGREVPGFADSEVATGADVAAACEEEPVPLKWDHPKYPTTAISTAAATPINIFLLSPVDSLSSVAPPKLNDGADPAYGAGSLCTASAGFSNRSAADVRGFSLIFGCGGSRAGAGALAAPPVTGAPGTAGLNSLVAVGADARGGEGGVATAARYKTDGASGAAGATGFSATGVGDAGLAAAGFAATGAAGHAGVDTGLAAGETGLGGSDEGLAAGTAGLGAGLGAAAAGVAAGVDGVAGTGVGTAAGAVGTAKLPVPVALPGLPGSLLRSNPRATRNVPFACSILMGLVRTRFAPIRKALATPA